jgi:hypothetical protein
VTNVFGLFDAIIKVQPIKQINEKVEGLNKSEK